MYHPMPWELFADPLGSVAYTLRTTGLHDMTFCVKNATCIIIVIIIVITITTLHEGKFTSSLVTLISVSEIKSIMSIILMEQTQLDYRYMESFLEIPITGKLFNMKQT